MTSVAIIPARGGSKGLKRKNILPLHSKPLIAYTIESALKSGVADKVIVSTEDKEIADVARKYGADVPFMRPSYLAEDHTPTIDVLKYTVEEMEKLIQKKIENIILLQPTSPLRNEKHIIEAYSIYEQNNRSPVVSITDAATHPSIVRKIVDGRLQSYIQEEQKATRRQDFEKAYELNGAIYITTRDMIVKNGCIYQDVVYPYWMAKEFSVDIDDEIDFMFAELLLKRNSGGIELD